MAQTTLVCPHKRFWQLSSWCHLCALHLKPIQLNPSQNVCSGTTSPTLLSHSPPRIWYISWNIYLHSSFLFIHKYPELIKWHLMAFMVNYNHIKTSCLTKFFHIHLFPHYLLPTMFKRMMSVYYQHHKMNEEPVI